MLFFCSVFVSFPIPSWHTPRAVSAQPWQSGKLPLGHLSSPDDFSPPGAGGHPMISTPGLGGKVKKRHTPFSPENCYSPNDESENRPQPLVNIT